MVFNVVDCPEQIDVFGEEIVGLGVTVTFVFAGKELQLFNVYTTV